MTPFRIVLVGVVLLLLAGFCLPYLSVDYLPSRGEQSFTISYSYPNRPPQIVEQEVTSLLENHLSQLEGIDHIRSVSRYGSGYLQLEVDPLTDISWMETYLASGLRQLHPALPIGCSIPTLQRKAAEDPSKSPLLIYELTYASDSSSGNAADQSANEWLTTTLLPAVSALPSIERVVTYGNRQYAWDIQWNPQRLQTLGINAALMRQQLSSYFSAQELGVLEAGNEAYALYYTNEPQSLEAILKVPLRSDLLIKDVATVREVPDKIRSYQRINGHNAIFINLYASGGVNRIQTALTLKAALTDMKQRFPKNYQLTLNYDDTEFLNRELNKTWTRAGLSVLVIALMILLSYRSWRYLVILSSSIVVSLALTVLLLWVMKLTIHLYSIAGITISLGIIVDNAIILADYIRKKRGVSAPLSGILVAQLAASLSTVAALLVILILPREYRADLTDFGWVISITLTCSFLVSWWFTPAIFKLVTFNNDRPSTTYRQSRKSVRLLTYYRQLIRLLIRRKNWVIGVTILAFGLPVFLIPSKWEGQEWYNQTMGSDTYQEEIRPVINQALGGSLRLFHKNVYEKSAYRTPEKTQLYLNAKLPYGHTLAQMNRIIQPAEEYLSQFDGIQKFITNVYSGRYASIAITFDESSVAGGFPYQLKNRLIQQSLDWGGVTWSVYGVGKGFSNAIGGSLPGYRVTMKGYNYNALARQAEVLGKKLLKHKRIQTVNTNSQLNWNEESLTKYRYRPDPLMTDIPSLQQTYQHIQEHSQQLSPALQLKTTSGAVPVYLTAQNAADFSLQTAINPGFQLTSLSMMGTVRQEESLTALHKEDRQYIRSVAFEYYGSYRFGKKYLDEVLKEMTQILPPGFTAEANEWSWSSSEEKQKYGLLLVLLVIIFFISAIFLENITQAILITLMIPLSYIGLFLIFSWGEFSFDQGGYAAFLMIGGLSINAMYFILAEYRQQQLYKPDFEALTKAVWVKAWPITMTVLSTCIGLLPFLIHGDGEVFWFSFAIGTIGGMLFSLLVAFILLPATLITPREVSVIKSAT